MREEITVEQLAEEYASARRKHDLCVVTLQETTAAHDQALAALEQSPSETYAACAIAFAEAYTKAKTAQEIERNAKIDEQRALDSLCRFVKEPQHWQRDPRFG